MLLGECIFEEFFYHLSELKTEVRAHHFCNVIGMNMRYFTTIIKGHFSMENNLTIEKK